jgi:glutamate synthase (NADPH/NADH) small chain
MEGAVTIGAVERSLVDQALNAGWQPPAPAPRSGLKVAVIGSGPAGLSCAERLNRMGVAVTVHDRAPRIGGLLRYGVPSFKLDKSLLDRRQALLEQAGICFVLDTAVDHALLSELLQSHDGIFLGLGAQQPRTIEMPGQELDGVAQGLRWLERVNSGERGTLRGRQVLILGGGDTAMDCARSARRLGADVTLAYRGPEEGLRASPKEIRLAREEEVAFLYEHTPVQLAEEGQSIRTVFQTPQGTQTFYSSDVILAFGQQPSPPSWLDQFVIATDRHGNISVDDQGRTTHPRIWAGGDNTLGPNLAVNAIAAGRKAAEGMLATFGGSHRLRRRA